MFGTMLLNHAPLLPCCANLCGDPSNLGVPLMNANFCPCNQRVGARLHVQLVQLRLVIEQIERRRRAGHMQINNATSPSPGRIGAFTANGDFDRAERIARQQSAQRDAADTKTGALQKLPPRQRSAMGKIENSSISIQPFIKTPSRFNNTFATDRPRRRFRCAHTFRQRSERIVSKASQLRLCWL